MLHFVIKTSGEKEPFHEDKLIRSLQKVGASQDTVEQILTEIQKLPEVSSTRNIYHIAFELLKKAPHGSAARYNIKNALYQLGPAGFSFEQFVSHIFQAQGYNVLLDQEVAGYCVMHEVDVVAKKEHEQLLVECKFHNIAGPKSDVKVALYVKARFEDIRKRFEQQRNHANEFHGIALVTNTQFTTDAITYGECAGIRLIGWAYPAQASLAFLIEQYQLLPITALTTLNYRQKQELIEQKLVLCRDLEHNKPLLERIEGDHLQREKIVQEARKACLI